MTTLDLTSTFIAPLSDLSDVLAIAQYAQSVNSGSRVDVRTYAGGRRRVISRPGETETLSLSYRYMTRDDYVQLSALVGVPVLLRDQRERAIYGIIGELAASEWNVADLVEDVSFTITEISHSEIV